MPSNQQPEKDFPRDPGEGGASAQVTMYHDSAAGELHEPWRPRAVTEAERATRRSGGAPHPGSTLLCGRAQKAASSSPRARLPPS